MQPEHLVTTKISGQRDYHGEMLVHHVSDTGDVAIVSFMLKLDTSVEGGHKMENNRFFD